MYLSAPDPAAAIHELLIQMVQPVQGGLHCVWQIQTVQSFKLRWNQNRGVSKSFKGHENKTKKNFESDLLKST